MTSAIVLVSLAFGIGVLLIFDGLTRERDESAPRRKMWLAPPLLGAISGAAVALIATRMGGGGPRRRRDRRTRAAGDCSKK